MKAVRFVGMDVRNDRVVLLKSRAALTAFLDSEPFFRSGFTSSKEDLREEIVEHRSELMSRYMEVV